MNMEIFDLEMSEGRLMHILLLDDQKLEIVVQPKLYAYELHDMAASHLRLKEKEFFGLTFRDETGHYQWLQLERRVLEHDFPRRSGPLVLYYQVRLYIESITYLRESITVKLFYLQAIQSLYKGQIECDSETVFELAAYVLQATHGDYTDDEMTRMHMKRLMLLSTSVLKQHPSLTYCEDQVIGFYKTLKGHTFGSATVNYMSIVESLPTYGIHYYEVKDKTGIPWWLGISFRGISVYDHADRKIPRKVFAWKQLENLYFREKKFSIEVVDLKKNTSGSVTVNVHSWMASTTQLAKCIWTMTVSQHQFYLNRKHRKSVSVPVRSLSDIADDINETLPGLENSDKMTGSEVEPDMISSSSSSSFTCSKADLMKAKELEAMRLAQQGEYVKLKVRKEELQQELLSKMNKLQELCLKEAELTGVVPPELPLKAGGSLPQVRKRIGTTFVLSPKFLSDDSCSGEDKMKKLEMEFEIQEKIMEAELQLAQDKSLPKSVRKKHRRTYRQEYQKLKELEGKINTLREQAGRERVVVAANSLDDLSEDSREFLDDDTELDTSLSPSQAPTPTEMGLQSQKLIHNYYRRYTHHELMQMLSYPSCTTPKAVQDQTAPRFHSPEGSLTWSKSLGNDSSPSCSTIRFYPKKVIQASPSPRSSPCLVNMPPTTPASSRVHGDSCSVSSAQSSESQFQSHPFLAARKQSGSSLGSDFTNSCSSSMSSLQQNSVNEREENLYNINTYLTGCYESGDELLNPSINPDENCQQWPTKHGSLDRRHNAQSRCNENCLSGSLELPELASLQFGSRRDCTLDSCMTPTQHDSNLQGGRLVRKNCSERSHHNRRREKLTEQAECIGANGQSTSNVYQFPGCLNRTIPAYPPDSKLRQQTAPVLYVASPTGETLGAQIPFEALSASHVDTMHMPQRLLSSDGDSEISAFENEFGELESREKQMESSLTEVLDSPEKLARFRKERYGRCTMVSNKALLPMGHNRDAVDALFRHHEETLSVPVYTYPDLNVVSSQSSSALCQGSELARASTPTPENSVI